MTNFPGRPHVWNAGICHLGSVICHPLRCKRSVLRILQSAYPGHRSGLAQVHIAVVLDVILQPRWNARAVSAGRVSGSRGVRVAIVLRVAVLFGVPVLSVLVAITATRFPKKEGERERNTPTQTASFSRVYRAKQGADTDEENNNFFHRAATLMPRFAHPAEKGKQQRGKGNDK